MLWLMADWIYNSFLSLAFQLVLLRFCWGFLSVAAVFRGFDSVFVLSFRLFDDYFDGYFVVVVVYLDLTSIIK